MELTSFDFHAKRNDIHAFFFVWPFKPNDYWQFRYQTNYCSIRFPYRAFDIGYEMIGLNVWPTEHHINLNPLANQQAEVKKKVAMNVRL